MPATMRITTGHWNSRSRRWTRTPLARNFRLMIELRDVRKRYGRARSRAHEPEALRGVSLAVAPGTITAVVGPNGAGKTTLFGIALGFLVPSSGDATIAGDDPRDWLNCNGAGWLPERFTPPQAWRVEETIAAFARMDGLGTHARLRARNVIERFGLGQHAKRTIGTLSRGLLQRVGLAQALIAQHRLIVLDEPTNGLDPEGRATFRAALAELRQHDVTILLASHDVAEIERIADSVVLLEDGRVRDILPARTTADYTRYQIRVHAADEVLRSAFPDRTEVHADTAHRNANAHTSGGDAPPSDGYSRAVSIVITVADAADLNRRLATLIASGGIVLEVMPVVTALEERLDRVRAAGEGGEGGT